MKGMNRAKHFWWRPDGYFTDGQSSRGLGLGCIKDRNTESISRNFVFEHGEGCLIAEYNKARASTNYFSYVIRYLLEKVAMLTFIYFVYICPFAKILYRNALLPVKSRWTISRSRGSLVVYQRKPVNDDPRKNHRSESAESSKSSKTSMMRCWTVDISFVLMNRSINIEWGWNYMKFCKRNPLNEWGVKINLWAWRQIIIGYKEHLEEIVQFFARDNRDYKEIFKKDAFYHIFSRQCHHKRRINMSTHGLDTAFPGQIQSALRSVYCYISRLWHHRLGLLKREEVLADWARVIEEKWDFSTEEDGQKEDHLLAKKRRKIVYFSNTSARNHISYR